MDTVNEDDSCTKEELDVAFKVHYSLSFNEIVTSKSTYLLHISGNGGSFIACGLSDHSIKIYDTERLSSVNCYGHQKGITGLRFSPKDENLVYSSSRDGSIKLWDIRDKNEGKCASEFNGKWSSSDGKSVVHALSAFDVCSRDRVIVAGTESDGVDSVLLFWDVRAPVKPAGAYWESHSEDITQVKFHPVQSDMMAVGSMDGLINIFDIRQSCEDEALINSLNTESSVDKISWMNRCRSDDKDSDVEDHPDHLSCITHEETLQIWDADDPSQLKDFSRSDIADALKVKSADDCYIVDVFRNGTPEEETLMLSGSNKSGCLRILQYEEGLLKPWACLGETSPMTRCCWAHPKGSFIATGGEGGVLCLWRPGTDDHSEITPSKESHKMKAKRRSAVNRKPY